MKPCLSVMHAKAHSWHCQVHHESVDILYMCTWSSISLIQILWGGRWQNGAAAGAGEDMEQLFSYMSRWSSTTKNMHAAGDIVN